MKRKLLGLAWKRCVNQSLVGVIGFKNLKLFNSALLAK